MSFKVILEPAEEGGYVAKCVEIPGAISQWETQEEAIDNVVDAIHIILDVRREEAERSVGAHRGAQLVEVNA